eukprot:TRINITY_DN251_c0_g1_i1.p1 TRINITY_DN251_c0_g1~~TRINITY_DN251_c0_g1_i1.p1  ORF type:complete len:493 (+),score=96.67 TRINITY_DN251_c0_g1_i1:54-1481(+)
MTATQALSVLDNGVDIAIAHWEGLAEQLRADIMRHQQEIALRDARNEELQLQLRAEMGKSESLRDDNLQQQRQIELRDAQIEEVERQHQFTKVSETQVPRLCVTCETALPVADAKFCNDCGANQQKKEQQQQLTLHIANSLPTGSAAECIAMAAQFEDRGINAKAGKLYAQAKQYDKALQLLLMCGEAELDAAIEVVVSSRSDQLQDQFCDYVMGEVDGVLKDGKWMFKLYMALGRFGEASSAAVAIAKGEMDLGLAGSYKIARDILRDTVRELISHRIAVPADLRRDLTLVHSYLLVGHLLTQGNQLGAARLLIRVCKYLYRFPKHVVQILTSATVTCHRANLKRSSYDFAAILMQREHCEQVDAKLLKPFKSILEQPEKGVDDDEPNAPCPYCAFPLPVYGLDCPGCKSSIPACVVSGRHMVLNDWTNCPTCRMPALYSAFTMWLAVDKTCPMCETALSVDLLTKSTGYNTDT